MRCQAHRAFSFVGIFFADCTTIPPVTATSWQYYIGKCNCKLLTPMHAELQKMHFGKRLRNRSHVIGCEAGVVVDHI